jgi:hypothetical protein
VANPSEQDRQAHRSNEVRALWFLCSKSDAAQKAPPCDHSHNLGDEHTKRTALVQGRACAQARAPRRDEALRAGFSPARNPEDTRTFLCRPALGDAAMGERFLC